jgi:hypothetical protein
LLHGLDGIGGFDLEGDGLASEGLDENLHCARKFCKKVLPTKPRRRHAT